MLLVNSTPVVVLLDSGALHSFISKEFPEHYHIPSKTMHNPLIVQSPGLENRAELECEGVKQENGGEDFWATLVVLESTRLDVILDMDWLSKNEAIIDFSRRSVHVTSGFGTRLTVGQNLRRPNSLPYVVTMLSILAMLLW
jgi:hypothetical protein